MDKIPEGGTVYIPMKRCAQCWHLNDWSHKVCSECGHLFVREATEEDKRLILSMHEERLKRAEREKADNQQRK